MHWELYCAKTKYYFINSLAECKTIINIRRLQIREISQLSLTKYYNYLFFDLALTGHHIEYLYHLIQYKIAHSECPDFILCTHPDFMCHLTKLIVLEDLQSTGVNIVHPSQSEMQRLSEICSSFKRAKAELYILDRIINVYQVKRCYLMYINNYQFALGSQIGRHLSCPVRGILFNPFGSSGARTPVFIVKFRKHLQLLWMLRNKNLEHIYILNNDQQVNALNRWYRKQNFFLPLPDPILITNPVCLGNSEVDVFERSSKIRFLLFGSLSARKGIFLVIDALRLLPQNITKDIEIFIAGRIVKEERASFLTALSDLKSDRRDIAIIYLDEFVAYAALAPMFLNSDCILLPYIESEASSGLLGHAALYERPVIGTDYGLIGCLIRRYELGIAIKNIDAVKLARAIADFYKKKINLHNTKGMQRFVQDHQPEKFVEILIG